MTPRARRLLRTLFRRAYLVEYEVTDSELVTLVGLAKRGVVSAEVERGALVFRPRVIRGGKAAA